MKKNTYELITNKIIEQLEKVDAADWSKPWFNVGYSELLEEEHMNHEIVEGV